MSRRLKSKSIIFVCFGYLTLNSEVYVKCNVDVYRGIKEVLEAKGKNKLR